MPGEKQSMALAQDLTFDHICSIFEKFPNTHGYHSIGFLQTIRSDVHWISLVYREKWRLANPVGSQHLCDSLDQEISHHLSQGQTVCVILYDEDMLPPPWPAFTSLCNRYQHEDFYLITQLGPQQQLIYTFQGELRCKILEIPWLYINDVIGYYRVRQQQVLHPPTVAAGNFLLMVNNWHNQAHKLDLMQAMFDKELHDHGLITCARLQQLPESFQRFVQANPMPFAPDFTQDTMGSYAARGNLWISALVENYLAIESTFDAPLIINPESRIGIFNATEKSLWPALLGRMYLIYGQPRVMSLMQRWHDVAQTNWADVSFDIYEGDWSRQANLERLELLLESNRYVITHAQEVYETLADQLERARWTIGPNILRFCLDQLDKIPRL